MSCNRPSQPEKSLESATSVLPSDKPLNSPGATFTEAFSLFNDEPKDILHEWQTGMSLKEKRAGISDGQLRSRQENQAWRTWAMSQHHATKGAPVKKTLPF